MLAGVVVVVFWVFVFVDCLFVDLFELVVCVVGLDGAVSVIGGKLPVSIGGGICSWSCVRHETLSSRT